MNWDNFISVWDEFLAFMDRAMQWLKFLFSGSTEEWPPVDYPDFNGGETA